MLKTIDFLPWVLIERRTDEVQGWTAHVLDFDLVTIGDSLKHTIEMAIEAACFLVTEDLTDGKDPITRRKSTPSAEWARVEAIKNAGTACEVSKLPAHDDAVEAAVIRLWISAMVDLRDTRRPTMQRPVLRPDAFIEAHHAC